MKPERYGLTSSEGPDPLMEALQCLELLIQSVQGLG